MDFHISNFLPVSEMIATSGQPEENDFGDIAEQGYQAVVNLAMSSSEGALPNEGDIVTSLGMGYVHIPVPFDRPTPQHFELFAAVMAHYQNRPVWLHCALNMRVSAFVYLYNRIYRALPDSDAGPLLAAIWRPDSTWRALIEEILSSHGLTLR
ncbi:protein tyrosine phosphatase family protein [Microbulbifer sp. TYP-18]|uniref:protein tyrosine phosphatase family protein n=1 Tax=Microbulbifer sp. TYP-18 TaxID=3230024 RepID=UPI0034C68BDD